MLNFKDFVFIDDLDRICEGVEDHQPKDGRWERPLSQSSHGAYYLFNVDGDNCGSPSAPCYRVSISGRPEDGVSIAFSRNGGYSDAHKGVGMSVFKGVLRALGEYVTTMKPAKMNWSPVRKSVPNPGTGTINNPDARAHVYDGWALRHLFPDKYVGMMNNWIRRDIYDREYVPNGYPPIPPEITAETPTKQKSEALESLRKGIEANQATIHQRERERERQEYERQEQERQRRDREAAERRAAAARQRAERLEQTIQNRESNPDGVQVGDTVYVNDPADHEHSFRHIAKVERFQLGDSYYGDEAEEGELHAVVRFARDENDHEFSGNSDRVLVRRLRKETSDSANERDQRRRAEVAALRGDPQQNPGGVDEGDDIITHIAENPTSNQNGLLGKVRRLKVDRGTLMALVDWDEQAIQVIGRREGQYVNAKFLRKSTPEQLAQIQRDRRNHEIEQEVQRNRERQQSRSRSGPEIQQSSEELQALINHPANPNHLKPGDYVQVNDGGSYRDRGRKGIIVRLEKPYYSDDRVEAYVQFHGSRAQPTRIWNLAGLTRDDSEEARGMQTRAAAAAERRNRTAAGTNGHQIGDTVTVATGVHRTKTGRILSFRTSGQNVSAVIAGHEGNFTVSVRALQPPANAATTTPPPTATESYNLSFGSFLRRRFGY